MMTTEPHKTRPLHNGVQTLPQPALDRIARLAARAFALHPNQVAAAVSLADDTCHWLVGRAGALPPMIPLAGSPCVQVVRTGVPCVVSDMTAHPELQSGLFASLGHRFYVGVPLQTPQGSCFGALCVMGPDIRTVTISDIRHLQDLAELVITEIELRTTGLIDPVSGLPNRRQLLDEIAQLDPFHRGDAPPRVLALIDLASPEELYHMARAVGTVCLEGVVRADSLTFGALLGPATRLYHVGATQFAFLAPPSTDPAVLARRLREDLTHAQLARDTLFSTTSTAGIASFLPQEAAPPELLRRAHAALDHARANRIPVGHYTPAQDVAFRRAFTLLNDFAAAMSTGDGLRLVFQPRLELASGRCVGVEALLRWNHPTIGEIPPAEFVRLIERTTMARGLMHWVLDKALRQLDEWRGAGVHVQLSINVSPANLEEDDFAVHVLTALARAHMPTTALELEITESTLLADTGTALRQLRALSDAGVSIAIDDFGTGYSSLSYLQRLPADVVKIDQSFVRGLTQSGADEGRLRTLVAAMIGLSHDLGYRVVAEGIETQDAADMLLQLQCDEVQGYHFARPMPPAAFLSWFAQRPWLPERRRDASSRISAAALQVSSA